MNYKQRTNTVLVIVLSVVLAACHSGNKETANNADSDKTPFSAQDSIVVRALADEFVNAYNNNDITSAANLLYYVHNDSIRPLEADARAGFMNAIQSLPHFGCGVAALSLYDNLDNQLRIAILMTPSGDLQTEKGTINFFLNPVKIGGRWYLTLTDPYAEGVGHYNL